MVAVARQALRSPYPYFGGKSGALEVVWRAFGSDVNNYVEPMFGSGAMLLGRPGGAGKIETVNDADGMICNFWRSIQQAPEEVARWCDWPVNECDLHPRHRYLIDQRKWLTKQLMKDPDFCMPKIAGWWVWGAAMWIGSGWCSARWQRDQTRPNMKAQGVHMQRPGLNGARNAPGTGQGAGVHQKLPDLYPRGHGRGTRAALSERGDDSQNYQPPEQCPDLGKHSGNQTGVHKRVLVERALSVERMINAGNLRRGINRDHAPACMDWFLALAQRLRRVRVCCGDWSRVLGNSVLGTTNTRNNGMVPCAVFLDPPYSDEIRTPECYAVDDGSMAQRVAQWAREHGEDPDLRIALCGYEGEHDMPGWTEHAWKAPRGYSKGNNREKERIWFSPHCLSIEPDQLTLAL